MDEEQTRKRMVVSIHGRVHGVGFRWFVISTARGRFPAITGWVKNCADGTVEVVAEGPQTDLEQFLTYLRRGPSHATVTTVDVKLVDPRGGMLGFDVTY